FFSAILSHRIGDSSLTPLTNPQIASVDGINKYSFQIDSTDKSISILLMRDPPERSNVQAQMISSGINPLIVSTNESPPLPDGVSSSQNASYAEISIDNSQSSGGNP